MTITYLLIDISKKSLFRSKAASLFALLLNLPLPNYFVSGMGYNKRYKCYRSIPHTSHLFRIDFSHFVNTVKPHSLS